MDSKAILDKILNSGKELLTQGKDYAEKALGVPKEGPERDAALKKLGAGAAVGGLAALLLGTKSGRSVSGKLLKYGSLAAVAAMAYKTYQNWNTTSGASAGPIASSMNDLQGEAANKRANLLLKAMIAAANADGKIDEHEKAAIDQHVAGLGLDATAAKSFMAELSKPLSAGEIAAMVDSPAAASEVYALSAVIVDEKSPQEGKYLADLASALKLPAGLVTQLDSQTAA